LAELGLFISYENWSVNKYRRPV